jgi:hypothetical protein
MRREDLFPDRQGAPVPDFRSRCMSQGPRLAPSAALASPTTDWRGYRTGPARDHHGRRDQPTAPTTRKIRLPARRRNLDFPVAADPTPARRGPFVRGLSARSPDTGADGRRRFALRQPPTRGRSAGRRPHPHGPQRSPAPTSPCRLRPGRLGPLKPRIAAPPPVGVAPRGRPPLPAAGPRPTPGPG